MSIIISVRWVNIHRIDKKILILYQMVKQNRKSRLVLFIPLNLDKHGSFFVRIEE